MNPKEKKISSCDIVTKRFSIKTNFTNKKQTKKVIQTKQTIPETIDNE